MEAPAKRALETFYRNEYDKKAKAAEEKEELSPTVEAVIPAESFYFMVCLVTGLVLVSPWVFYQGWAFVAAGLYRHERHYVQKYLPTSIGLFLAGVFLCFGFVLPITPGFPPALGNDPVL